MSSKLENCPKLFQQYSSKIFSHYDSIQSSGSLSLYGGKLVTICRNEVKMFKNVVTILRKSVNVLGKRKHTPPCSSAELFFAEKKWGPQSKDFGGGYGFPGLYLVFVFTTGLDIFSLRPEKFPKWFSFGGGRVRFFLFCFRSGRIDPTQFSNRALFAYENGRSASSFLLLGIGLLKPRKRQICLSKVPLRNPI